MILYAPAKVNLCLRILSKRPDGYHNIETVFERIALSDKIVLRSLPAKSARYGKIKLFCNHPAVPLDKDSLVRRTISLLEKGKQVPGGIEVKIFKKIPIGSGLGGGSSDAAALLMGLNRLWKLSLDLPALLKLGKKLGADVPFFLKGCSFAAAKGRGDEIAPLNWKTKFWHLLISPPIKLLSKDIYNAYNATNSGDTILNSKKKFNELSIVSPEFQTNFELTNDLEDTVLEKAPIAVKFKNALKNIGLADSLVSGSGPSIFSLFANRKEAEKAKTLLIRRFPFVREKGCQIFIVPTL